MQGHSNKKVLLNILKQLTKNNEFKCSFTKKNKLIIKSVKNNNFQYIIHPYCRDYKPLSRWLNKSFDFELII